MFTEIDLAYAAGIIDGEGCISISKLRSKYVKSRSGYDYALSVSFVIREKELCDWFELKFGGKVFFNPISKKNPKHSDVWLWRVTRSDAIPFLATIEPYLKLKLLRARNALEFQKNIKTKRTKPLSDGELAVREAQYILQRNLNAKGSTRLK